MSEPTKPTPEAPITMKQVLELIPQMIASAVAATSKAPVAAAPVRGAAQNFPKCNDCKQVLKNDSGGGCGGRHTMMVVHPLHHAEYFPGAIINGVKYLSNDPGHRVLVPADAEATIAAIVNGYEQNEREMSVGRKAERHSGSVSPNGSNTVQQHAAWR